MLDPRPQFDTYAPGQGEIAALRFQAESAGIPGGRGRWHHWCGGPLGTASSGAGPRAHSQSARPTPAPGPARHTDGLKGPHMPMLRGLQDSGRSFHPTELSRQEANEGPTRNTLPRLGVGLFFVCGNTNNVPQTKEVTCSYYHNLNASIRGEKNCGRKQSKHQGKYIVPTILVAYSINCLLTRAVSVFQMATQRHRKEF